MADTITIFASSPTNPVVATDEVTIAAVLQHVQRMKLVDGSDGGTTLVQALTSSPAGTEGGLVTRPIPSGTQIIQGLQGANVTGNIVAATTTITANPVSGYNVATVQVSGTYAGVSFVFEGSLDGTNWVGLQGQQSDTGAAANGATTLTNTLRAWDVDIGSYSQFRVRATAWTSGTAAIVIGLQTMATIPVPTVVQGPAGTVAWLMGGDVANAATDAGNPVKTGGVVRSGVQAAAIAGTAGQRVNLSADAMGALWTRPPATWNVNNQPAAATTATASRAAGAAGIKNVCLGVSFHITANSAPGAIGTATFNLRDGAAGAGTVIASWKIAFTTTAPVSQVYVVPGLWLEGTAATAMTFETSAAPTTNVTVGVNMFGTTTT